jgi:hypothetical protein
LLFHIHLNGFVRLWDIFSMKVEISHLNAVYNFSNITVYKRPDDGSHLVPKLIKTGVVCDWFDTYACNLLTSTGCLIWKKNYYSWNPIANVHWVCTERCARTCLWNVLSLWTHHSKYHLYIYLLVKVNTFLNKIHNFRWLCTYSVSEHFVLCDNLDLQTLFDIACLCKYCARDIVNYYCWVKWSAKWNEFQLFIYNINLLKPGSFYTACTVRFNTKNFTFFLHSVFLLHIRRAIR